MELQNWLLFVSIAFIATITPGPAILLATTHSISYGLKNALFTIFGNISGLFLMSALSVGGLSAILLNSSSAFMIIKYVGAAYLIYLGVRLWHYGFMPIKTTQYKTDKKVSRGRLYLNGLAVALSNPKAIAFTTALFPQFIDPAKSLYTQFGLLIVTFMFLSFGCIFVYAYAVHTTHNKLFSSTPGYLSKLFGVVFILSGIVLANATNK
jgi:threonine/homoserine/homoserine lactone efflux protein